MGNEEKTKLVVIEEVDGRKIATLPTKEEALMEMAEIDSEYDKYLESLPEKVRVRVMNSRRRLRTGLHATAPIMCFGSEKCPFLSKCPVPERDTRGKIEDLKKDGDYPIGKDCVLEKFYIQQKMIEYYQYLDVDPSNPVEMSIVNELALIDLYKNRAIMIMSTGDLGGEGRDFMKTDILGYSESGDAAAITKVHPAIEIIERLERRREKWLDKLLETRKSKADWIAKMGGEKVESRFLEEIQKLREVITANLPTAEGKALEAPIEDGILLDD